MKQKPSSDVMIARLNEADPIDTRALADRIAPLTEDVLAEIIGSNPRAPFKIHTDPVATGTSTVTLGRRGRWPLVAAAACATVVAMTALLGGLLPGESKPAYAITVDGGVVVVNWMRDLRDGSEIGNDLRDYGVDATVRAVPASPSLVGRVLTVAVDGVEAGDMPPGVSWGADGTDEVFTWRIDPSQFKESIQIEIGVEPDGDEPYTAAESSFAPGEVLGGLHCALEEPITAAAVDKQLQRLGLDVQWFRVVEAAESVDGDLGEDVPSRTPPAGPVINVQPIDSRTVRVSVAPPGAPLTAPIFTPVRPSAECTPELASRWIGVI